MAARSQANSCDGENLDGGTVTVVTVHESAVRARHIRAYGRLTGRYPFDSGILVL